ncbi:MAG TPA: cupin domain-containing protein [Dissulfurispiraceae bacterium]|nr:cupin domain-containing protein [Dissulfurispiraceae bacterium]
MKVIKYTEAPAKHYSNAQVKGVEARVVIGKQDGAENFFMRVFDIAPAGNTPRHTHDWEHEMFCHAGEGEVFCGEQWHRISAGNVVFIPANAEHQIRNSGENNLSIVCLVPAKAPEL